MSNNGPAVTTTQNIIPVGFDASSGNLIAGGVSIGTPGTTSGAGLITTKTLGASDAGKVNEVAANATLTVTPGFAGCIVKVVGGTASIAFSGGATGNGAGTTITRAAFQMFTIDPNITGAPNAFTVTGA